MSSNAKDEFAKPCINGLAEVTNAEFPKLSDACQDTILSHIPWKFDTKLEMYYPLNTIRYDTNSTALDKVVRDAKSSQEELSEALNKVMLFEMSSVILAATMRLCSSVWQDDFTAFRILGSKWIATRRIPGLLTQIAHIGLEFNDNYSALLDCIGLVIKSLIEKSRVYDIPNLKWVVVMRPDLAFFLGNEGLVRTDENANFFIGDTLGKTSFPVIVDQFLPAEKNWDTKEAISSIVILPISETEDDQVLCVNFRDYRSEKIDIPVPYFCTDDGRCLWVPEVNYWDYVISLKVQARAVLKVPSLAMVIDNIKYDLSNLTG